MAKASMGTSDRPRLSGPQLGSLIGAVAGALFIVINAGGTGSAGPIRIVGIALFLAAVFWGVVRAPEASPAQLSSDAGRIYRLSVVAEIVAIPLGAAVINNVLDRPELTVLWVVAVVGLHFLPFARAFDTTMYAWLGWAMIAIATCGIAATLATGRDSTAAWFAVTAGIVVLGFCVVGPRLAATTARRS
ncbi:MAG: hypothetical protein ABIN55_04175 [Aeromicrobium sp.]